MCIRDSVLCEDIEYEDSVDGFAKLMFAKALGYLFTSHKLHEDHWAQPFIKDLNQEKVRISGKVIARDYFSGGFVSADAVSYTHLILASRIAFIGWILGFIAGEVSNLISDYKRTKSLTHTLRRKR